ncbi:TPA: hypothetical protein HA235_03710 [Candidatus Woesearchaeota archaeon]|nr:hypothetical protein [Candidatus Woesearchaeota archaeon]HIH31788.1 hypothetical protein [Candidatus Woesearchaeota archaeon]HIH55332.1 hypothetical protein [Candidatus Woesearchaeota archaeon]HIJ01861.1 hypothetical protein [Candidatus Woesearchaeota archaeon]HIJ13812.1 hypothetical protein [Candidatus Woesearchaeota archaeon]
MSKDLIFEAGNSPKSVSCRLEKMLKELLLQKATILDTIGIAILWMN